MLRLETPLDFRVRQPGKYLSTRGGILIPDDSTFFTARIWRPNPLKNETAWPDRGAGGKADPHPFDNDQAEYTVGGIDTEVLRGYFFMSFDGGLTWQPAGHVGTAGGHRFNARGDPMIETTYTGWMRPGKNRLIQFALDVRERIETKVDIDLDDIAPSPVVRRDLHHSIAVEDTAGGQASSATSVSTSTNLDPTGSDRYLWASGANSAYNAADYVDLVFGGVSQTVIWDDKWEQFTRTAAVYSTAPSTTGATLTYSISGAGDERLGIAAVAFSGVDQTTPHDAAPAASTGGTTAPSHSITAGDSGDVRIAVVVCNENTSMVVGANETSRVEVENIDGYPMNVCISTKEDGGSDPLNWTPNGGAAGRNWYMRGQNLNVAAAGGVTSSPGKGHIVFSGKAPTATVTLHVFESPGKAHIVFTGKAPTVTRTLHVFKSPGKGHIIFTGKTPTTLTTAHQTVSPTRGHIVFNGKVPNVNIGFYSAPGKGHITFTGRAPSATVTALIFKTPASGSIVFTGQAPTVTGGSTAGPADTLWDPASDPTTSWSAVSAPTTSWTSAIAPTGDWTEVDPPTAGWQ